MAENWRLCLRVRVWRLDLYEGIGFEADAVPKHLIISNFASREWLLREVFRINRLA